MTAGREERRWVVRYDGAPDAEWFRWGSGNYPARVDTQRQAHRFLDRVDAVNVASNTGGRTVRLVPRAEAVSRERTLTLLDIRNAVYGLRALDDMANRPASISNPYQAALADVLNRLRDIGGDAYEEAQR